MCAWNTYFSNSPVSPQYTPLSFFLSAVFVSKVWYRREGSHLLIKRLRQHTVVVQSVVLLPRRGGDLQERYQWATIKERDFISKRKRNIFMHQFMRINALVVSGGTSIFITVCFKKSSKTECPIIIPFPFFVFFIYLHVAISERRSKSINSLLVSQAESSWDNLV